MKNALRNAAGGIAVVVKGSARKDAMTDLSRFTMKITGPYADSIPVGVVEAVGTAFEGLSVRVASLEVEDFSWRSFGNYTVVVVTQCGRKIQIMSDRGQFFLSLPEKGLLGETGNLVPIANICPEASENLSSLSEQLAVLAQNGFFAKGLMQRLQWYGKLFTLN